MVSIDYLDFSGFIGAQIQIFSWPLIPEGARRLRTVLQDAWGPLGSVDFLRCHGDMIGKAVASRLRWKGKHVLDSTGLFNEAGLFMSHGSRLNSGFTSLKQRINKTKPASKMEQIMSQSCYKTEKTYCS